MFLIPAADFQDDNGALALFAEDFHFASLWRMNLYENNNAETHEPKCASANIRSFTTAF